MAILDDVKTALRVTTTAYDNEIQSYIDAALVDLEIAGVLEPTTEDALTARAVITFARMSFGSPSDYERLKKSYDEQKAQLTTATGFTDWGDGE